ncbi:type II toxin-antitoxin system prevent-host-death family antitoxin [Sphingomonas abietis]|uniref:Antitoxin n=1 Tax=Sphingomonas abietis TaxID=3012344 RepID=A0ABY7NJP2_9SPHN|nr:type II toxin-antitoxin system prevent-host-death family antitoxin [Sphingomonas abietis]WBO21762.1 type II toxin-antitoxin system prevent-host-death family antitoxin [Sphingomonas abietis]
MAIAVRKGGRETASHGGTWKLEDAKARFSELVRLAESEGPQRVTVRGREAVVVMSVAELNRLLPEAQERPGLVSFLEGLGLDGLPIEREIDRGRNVAL